MKSVFLIGDSIRLGYERYVKGMLEGRANVYSPKAVNGGMAQFVQRWCHAWIGQECNPEELDLIHFNAGLWDVLRILGDEPFTSPEFYAETLKRITLRLKKVCPKAKLVFALSTAVLEDLYIGDEYKRYNADIEKYNEIAKKTLAPLGVEFNDLYSVTRNAPREVYSDPTHFNTVEGIKLTGGQVVSCICEKLGIDESGLEEKEAELFEIPEQILGN
ncbi:MAG: SGNH/GDSL hydrolase family protein [Clostridia bacterium]|nr:SGNH/GDSL hydrolase family protein [Clostridia bacterium]